MWENEIDFGLWFVLWFGTICLALFIAGGIGWCIYHAVKWLGENIWWSGIWDNTLGRIFHKRKKRKIFLTRRQWRKNRGDFFWFLG